ncbi:MAG TPA: hypothetical protein VNS33_14110 [Bradyrhizobium sp.]|jgi:hypothetical protein|nr:hypothetical protein [Bradyrhizobium sp.]
MSGRIATAHELVDRAGSQPKALRVRSLKPDPEKRALGLRPDGDAHRFSIATNAKRLQGDARISSLLRPIVVFFAHRWTEMFSTT